ncbi:metallopeptidase M24 family protein [Mycobacterium xenopi 3993]|nr:metallopeptidase M24 family protein [Mycobacterium xenopi 3993]
MSLDRIAEAVIRDAGARPSFLGYHGYPASICTSVNDRVVHGIPSAAEILAPGDLVSVDCGAVLDGWHGDAAITFGVGTLNPADEALCQATKESLEAGIAAMTPGKRLTDVSHAIETGTHAAEARYGRAFGIVEGYGGHGIGRQMHMDPFLPNEGPPAAARCWPWVGAGNRTDADAGKPENPGPRRSMDGYYRRRLACGTLGAHRGGDRGRTADLDSRLTVAGVPVVNRTGASLVSPPGGASAYCRQPGGSRSRLDEGALRRARRGLMAICAEADR